MGAENISESSLCVYICICASIRFSWAELFLVLFFLNMNA